MRLALGAVVELVLAQLLLAGEGLQAAVQADGLGLGPPRLLHAAVFLHNLWANHDGQDSKQDKGFCFVCVFSTRRLNNEEKQRNGDSAARCCSVSSRKAGFLKQDLSYLTNKVLIWTWFKRA